MNDDDHHPLRFLPVALNLRGRRCMVVGGGTIGSRKVNTLLRAGADVTVVSPIITGELTELINTGTVRWEQGGFDAHQLDGAFLVVAATDDVKINTEVVAAAQERSALVCDASSAEQSDVIFGALHQADDVTVAVFTDGRDPSRARRTRDQLADLMPGDEPTDAP